MIKKVVDKIKLIRVKKNFLKKVEVDKSSIKLLLNARCQNTGPKNNITIGKHCTINAQFLALFDGKIQIGDNNYIGAKTMLLAKEKIVVGNNVIIANDTIISDNNNHPIDPAMRFKMSQCDDYMTDELWSWKYADSKPVIIEDNVWIGRDVRIMKGVTVGKGSIVALGAIVTKDVPPYTIVAGNPAKVVKYLKVEENNEETKC